MPDSPPRSPLMGRGEGSAEKEPGNKQINRPVCIGRQIDLSWRWQGDHPGPAAPLAEKITNSARKISFPNQFCPRLSVALYADNGGIRTLLSTQSLGRIAYPGDLLAPLTFTIALSDIGSDGLVAVVDDDGTGAGSQNECDESNNTATWNEATCQ